MKKYILMLEVVKIRYAINLTLDEEAMLKNIGEEAFFSKDRVMDFNRDGRLRIAGKTYIQKDYDSIEIEE